MKAGWTVGILLLVSGLLQGQTSPQRGLAPLQDTASNVWFPLPVGRGRMSWTGSRLAGCDFCEGANPIVWAVDREGNRKSVAFDIGAGYTNIADLAAGPDGALVAVGFAMGEDSRRSSFLAWISPDAGRQIVTRVSPYSGYAVTVAPDGTIWTVGAVLNDRDAVVYPNVLRHYTSSGELLASTWVRGVRKNSGGSYLVSQASALVASNDRIGWLTQACQYFEFSFEAVQLGSYPCPNGYKFILDVSGAALSSTHDFLIGSKWVAPLAPLELDRATNTWRPVPVYHDSGKTHKILGFDGQTLVTSTATSSPSMRRYGWSDRPSASDQ